MWIGVFSNHLLMSSFAIPLYTAVYCPAERTVEYRGPGSVWRHSLDTSAGGEHAAMLGLPAA